MKVGDIVEVIDSGSQYSIYKKLADVFGIKDWKSGSKLDNGDIGVIRGIKNHLSNSKKLIALIDVNGKEAMINIRGLKLINGDKMKKGDRVVKARRYNKDKYCKYGGGDDSVPIGSAGKISRIGVHDKIVVDFDNDMNGWSLDKSELELESIYKLRRCKMIDKKKVENRKNNKGRSKRQDRFV